MTNWKWWLQIGALFLKKTQCWGLVCYLGWQEFKLEYHDWNFLILYHFFCGQDIILSHLLERYLNNQIYTYIGDILIAVNPLQTLNLYGPEVSVQKFFITVFQLPANYFVSVFSSNIWRTINYSRNHIIFNSTIQKYTIMVWDSKEYNPSIWKWFSMDVAILENNLAMLA